MSKTNIIFIMSDDHAAHAISAYGSRVNSTPHLDRIAEGGMRLDAVYCTNSICSPSRASILTGTYSHINGVSSIWTTGCPRLWTCFTGRVTRPRSLENGTLVNTAMPCRVLLMIGRSSPGRVTMSTRR